MKILESSWSGVRLPAARRCVTLGTFDGVHLGHQALLAETCAIGRRADMGGSVVLTFGRHPRSVLSPDAAPDRLTSDAERAQLLAATGIDTLVVLDFDDELARLGYEEFVREVLLDRLGMAHLVLGHDVHFGRDRGGNLHSVAALAEVEGFGLQQVASVRYAGEPISSTRLRQAIREGDLEAAGAMLGHPYLVRGTVGRGEQIGRSLGFPTANLQLDHPRKLLPPRGVYGGWARRPGGSWRPAVTNIGVAPTVTAIEPVAVRVEVHLLGETEEFYGEAVELLLARRLRAEKRFAGRDELRAAIASDVGAWEAAAAKLSPDIRFSEVGGPLPRCPAADA